MVESKLVKSKSLTTATQSPAKQTARKKAISQAAQKRLQEEDLEASKNKAEKLAERLVEKNKSLAKHASVKSRLDDVAGRKPKPPNLKVKSVAKVKQQKPAVISTELDALEEKIWQRDQRLHELLKQANGIKNRIEKIAAREKTKLAEALRDCYGIYEFVESTNEPWQFYDILRDYFKAKLERIQSNTPDESLLIRFVFTGKSDKQVSEYGTVLRYALDNKIAKNGFVHWYTKTTQTKILALARNSNTANSRDRLERARQLLLKYFDLREEWPLGVMPYPEHLLERQIHLPDDFIFVICRGVRRFDRGTNYNPDNPSQTQLPLADVRALHFVTPNVDLSNDIINRIARFMVPQLERYEVDVEETANLRWANDMTSFLMERELGASYKSADIWAARQQAALSEDQQAFIAEQKKIQKLRAKSRGN